MIILGLDACRGDYCLEEAGPVCGPPRPPGTSGTFLPPEGGAAAPCARCDPFDRMLVAQAQAERMALVTADEQIGKYKVKTVGWARRATLEHGRMDVLVDTR